jgi:hypothetical protein
MALLIEAPFETPQGIELTSSYWRWVGLGVDVPATTLNGVLYAYASPAAFAAGKQPVGQKQYTVRGADFLNLVAEYPVGASLSEVLSNAVYAYVKANDPFFATAQDVE